MSSESIYSVSTIKKWEEDSVTPNFVYNRFDLLQGRDQKLVEILKVESSNIKYVVEAYYQGKEATLGLWLSNISDEAVTAVAKYIFVNHSEIKKIYFSHSLQPHGITENHNHFRVDLPDKLENFDQLGTRKERYNVRRRIRKFNDEQGEIIYKEYDLKQGIPYTVIMQYMQDKEDSYKLHYQVPKTKAEFDEFVREHELTNIYTMNKSDGTIVAIIFSCEQCPCVYIENITFDPQYKKYFPGILLYDHYLRCLVEKQKKSLFLGGGQWEFKRRYKSHEDKVYECRIYRGVLNQWFHKIGEKIKHHKAD